MNDYTKVDLKLGWSDSRLKLTAYHRRAATLNLQYAEPDRRNFSRFCCCLLVILVLLVVALGATILALYFVFRPQVRACLRACVRLSLPSCVHMCVHMFPIIATGDTFRWSAVVMSYWHGVVQMSGCCRSSITQGMQDIVGMFASFPPLSELLLRPFSQAPQFSLDNVKVNDLIIVPDTTNASSILAAANTTGNNPTLDGTALPPIPSNPALSNDVSASIAALLRGNTAAAATAAAPAALGMNLTGLGLGFRLNATINFTLQARNPNKVGVDYQAVNVSLSYRSLHVGDSVVSRPSGTYH